MARKYARDNRGRFASSGSGATARGGRLKTASGNKRATQTMKAAGAGGVIKGRTARTVAGEKVMAKMAKREPTGAKSTLKRTGQVIKKARSRPPATTLQYKQALPVTNANRARRDRASNVMQRSVSGTVGFSEMQKLRTKAGVAANPYSNMSKSQRTKAVNDLAKAELQNKKASKSYAIGARAYDRYTNLVGYTQGDGRKKWRRAGQRSTSLGAGTIRGGAQRSINPARSAAPTKAAPSQKPGTVPLNQVRRYNALDRARYKQKQKYSREMSVVTGAIGPGALQRIDRSFKEAKLASRKTSRIEATMRRLSNSPNSPNVPVLPRAKQLGEMVTGRRNLYRRMTPRITASPVAGTIKKPAPKPPGPPTPTGSRTRSQARAAQRNRREQVLDRGRTGVTGLGSMRKNPRIRKVQTGMSQLSLMGKAKPLVRFKPAGRRR